MPPTAVTAQIVSGLFERTTAWPRTDRL